MLFKETDNLEEAFHTLKHELKRGYLDKRHPFRYVALSTVHENKPFSRYVVLRKIDEDFNMLIYTDSRSQKTDHIAINEHVNLLLWHPGKKVQVRVEGRAELAKDKEAMAQTWAGMNEESRKAYISESALGKKIESP